MWNTLQSLSSPDKLILEQLKTPTYDALLDRMAHTDYHLIHFDGHGVFARRCPRCRAANYPHLTTCGGCQATLAEVPAQGYLVFRDSAGAADFVSTESMENLLLNSPVRLANVTYLARWREGLVLPLDPLLRRMPCDDRYELYWMDHLPRPGTCTMSLVVGGGVVKVPCDARRLPPLLRTLAGG